MTCKTDPCLLEILANEIHSKKPTTSSKQKARVTKSRLAIILRNIHFEGVVKLIDQSATVIGKKMLPQIVIDTHFRVFVQVFLFPSLYNQHQVPHNNLHTKDTLHI